MSKPAALGVDIGGTKTLCVLVNKQTEPIERVKFKTAPHRGKDKFAQKLTEALKALEEVANEKGLKIAGIGLGCAGRVDDKSNRILSAPNLMCLEGYPLGKALKKLFRTEVTIGNDVHLGLYAEHKLGAAAGCSNVLGVFFGTGVGGAAIINGQLHLGASGMGGQVGCVLAQPVGGPKAALSHGIVDRIASKAAIASDALVMAMKEWAPYLHRKVGTDLTKVTWGMLSKAIARGDEKVEEMLRARMRVVGIALSSVVNFLNPEMVVLGGGLVNEMPKLVLEELEAGLREYLVPEVSDKLKVKNGKLNGNAVALGAAHQALEKFVKGRA
jgi:glucokinase